MAEAAAQKDRPDRVSSQLRSSCNPCAEAKVGCTKEKPRCARCERRGDECVYAAARRAGRPSQNKQQTADRQNHSSRRLVTPPNTSTTTPSPETIAVAHPVHVSPGLSLDSLTDAGTDHLDVFSDLTTADNAAHSLMAFASNAESDDFAAFFDPLSDHAQPFSHGNDSIIDPGLDNGIFFDDIFQIDTGRKDSVIPLRSIFTKENVSSQTDVARPAGSTLFRSRSQSTTAPTTPFNSLPSSSWSTISDSTRGFEPLPSSLGSFQESSYLSSASTCGCLVRAVSLLDQLTLRGSAGVDAAGSETGWVKSDNILARNERTLLEMKSILDCHCSNHLAFSFILSLIVLKVLGWYALVVCSMLGIGDNLATNARDALGQIIQTSRLPSSVPSDHYDDEQQEARVVCQVVLSRLHGVQRIVNVLSKRFEVWQERELPTDSSSAARMCNIAQNLLLDEPSFRPGSSKSLASTLEAELRSRLRELSQVIRDALRE